MDITRIEQISETKWRTNRIEDALLSDTSAATMSEPRARHAPTAHLPHRPQLRPRLSLCRHRWTSRPTRQPTRRPTRPPSHPPSRLPTRPLARPPTRPLLCFIYILSVCRDVIYFIYLHVFFFLQYLCYSIYFCLFTMCFLCLSHLHLLSMYFILTTRSKH